MRRVVQVLVLAALVVCGCWLWTVLFPTPEAVVRNRLNGLAKALSFKSGSGLLSQALQAQKAAEFFTTDADIDVNVAGYDPLALHGRDEVQQIATAARVRLSSLKIDFPDMNITIDPGGQTAKVNLTGKAEIPGERDISAQEFNFLLKKVDGQWLIYKVETVKTLSEIEVSGARYQVSGINWSSASSPDTSHLAPRTFL